MRNLCKMVGVTYGEFQSWYNYGEIRILYNRLVHLKTTPEGGPDPESPLLSTLLERIPQLNLEDEEGILLIQLKPVDINISDNEIDPETIYLPIECIQSVIPLTERAGRILETRLGSFGVKISPSYFHQQVRETWFRFGVRKALRGGNTLVRALFENGLQIIDETLRKSVEFGIWKLDYRDCSREDVSGNNITWIAEAFKYSRREPSKHGDLDYMIDTGMVLNEAFKSGDEEKSPRLGPFREVLEEAIDKRASLVEVFKDTESTIKMESMERDLFGTTSVGLTSLVLFLRWKDRFQKMNQEVDFRKLYEETAEFAGSISFENTVSAVWMFGCYVGHENVTPVDYASDHEMFSFSLLTEPRITEKISKPEEPETESKIESKHGEVQKVDEEIEFPEVIAQQQEEEAEEEAQITEIISKPEKTNERKKGLMDGKDAAVEIREFEADREKKEKEEREKREKKEREKKEKKEREEKDQPTLI